MAYRIDSYDNSIVIDGWEKGIADSPFDGISNMRNVNVISVPGEASVNYATTSATLAATSGNVTNSSDTNDTLTLDTAVAEGTTLVFTGASLPGGVSAGTKYLINCVGGSPSTTVRLYTSYANYLSAPGSGYQNITSDGGTGTFVSTDMAKPNMTVQDATGKYILDVNGRAWKLNSNSKFVYLLGNDTTTTTNASGNGMVLYYGYLFVFRNALIDYMNTTTGAWTYAWQTMNTAAGSSNSHYALVGQDNTVYYCDGAYLGSFFQKPGSTFDPSSSSTYTRNQQALLLPSYEIAQCLAELGINLLVGGVRNAIYPWNRSATSFTYPILLSEDFIHRMVTVNTNTYVFAGQRGRIYITNGSQASLFKKIPDHISGTREPYFKWGDAIFSRNQLYFGISCTANDGATTAIPQYGGVWAIDLDSDAVRLTQQLSYATYAGLATTILGPSTVLTSSPPSPAFSDGMGLVIGWDSGASTFGADISSSSPYTSSQATIDTDLIPIGTYDKPRDFTRIEYRLTRPLVANESITIYYRLIFNTSSTGYTQVLTDNTAGNYSLSGPVNFKNAQWVQFQIVLNSTASSPSYVRLKEMRILGLVS